jgi:hypothetical protein
LHPAPYSPKSQSEETNEIVICIITVFCTVVQNREENKTKEADFISPNAKFIKHNML